MTLHAQTSVAPPSGLARYTPIVSIGLLFFIFGFITWLNGALIPFLQMVCELTEIQALLIAFCFYIAYVVMALPMAKILEKTGYQKGMSLGLGIIALGCALFVPAALSAWFPIFLLAQFVVGSGLTILQTASNPFIVRLGSEESAAARIAFMGLLNKAAGVLAPIIFTALVLNGLPDVNQEMLSAMAEQDRAALINDMSVSLIQPYIGMAIALAVLALGFTKINLPAIGEGNSEKNSEQHSDQSGNADSSLNTPQADKRILQFPHLVLGAVSLFFYVGVEVVAGDTIGLYGSSLGVDNATTLTSYTMVAMVIGYAIGLVCIPRLFSQQAALLGSAVTGVLFTCAILFASDRSTSISDTLWGWAGIQVLPNSVALIALLGFANALVWPAIWPLALNNLGKYTAQGSALLIMGIAGGAILPMVYGGASEWVGGQHAYAIMLPCYCFIGYYAIWGSKKQTW
ncbi:MULTISPECIES: sugar MFS transporter [unclassified Alteromonas]|uniref:sugar MFS transporter n=1 Tax=unclassified Alteromonas TaxID=2614992 RepID=UPI0005098A53|nr:MULTISPECIES: sugar MFS transporter [unclassified Alteromonas]